MADQVQPIIIKKVKKGGHGHHGGAWKVAYADFVTAMMAFFLLLWLLNAVTQDQLEGIANYFAPISLSRDTSGAGEIYKCFQTPGGSGESFVCVCALAAPETSSAARPSSRKGL